MGIFIFNVFFGLISHMFPAYGISVLRRKKNICCRCSSNNLYLVWFRRLIAYRGTVVEHALFCCMLGACDTGWYLDTQPTCRKDVV